MSRKADFTEVAVVAARPYWRSAEARVVVEGWRRSGEPLWRFAKRHGVDPRRIARWASRLRSSGSAAAAVEFHPVRLVHDASPSRSAPSIEIQLVGGPCVRVAGGFETDDLRRVLAVLEEGTRC
jgi:hypothetical protein